MPFPLWNAPEREASAFNGFAGNRIDRRSEQRRDDDIERALADPSARVLLVANGQVWTREGRTSFAPSEISALPGLTVLLGWNETHPVLALAPEGEPRSGFEAVPLRGLYAQGTPDEALMGTLAQANALLNWHANNRFCARCGHPSEMRGGGVKRACPSCGAEHFPRTDPVVIMLTVQPDACLLGRGAHFAPGMYSALAGFIEPGETIEDAVRRETFEEAGIRLGRVDYHASQPWPFPHSLMIGCFGEALDTQVDADLEELESCRWFSRDEVRLMIDNAHPDGLVIPPPSAIASHLIRFWAEN